MSFVPSYIKCDICGKSMNKKDEPKYKIMPRKAFRIREYLFFQATDNTWSREVDMCNSCWEEMKGYILAIAEVNVQKEKRRKLANEDDN